MAQYYGSLLRAVRGPESAVPTHLSVGVTAVQAGAGASTVTLNLGWRAASEKTSTLLVDLDQKRNDLTRLLNGNPRSAGLMEFLQSEVDLVDCLQETSDEHLQLLGFGSGDGLIAPGIVTHVLQELTTRFELVLFDLPPVSEVGLWQSFAPSFDAVLLVLEAEREDRRQLQEAKRQLSSAGIEITGAVWNKQRVR
jgi:capsular exopolysaccharide synthesis family protein